MTLHRTIDFREFEGLLIERAMADLGMTERHVAVLQNMLKQGATEDELERFVLMKFPNWLGRANAIREIVAYLRAGRRGEE